MPTLALLAVALVSVILPPQDDTKRVHDRANLLAPADRAALEQIARNVEDKTTAQMAIVTVPSLEGLSVDDYAHQLFNAWGIGQKKVNNGVLLLIAPKERRMRIEVGYGLEPLLTDELCGQIRDSEIIPRFKANDYSGGVVAGGRRIATAILADPAAARGDPNSGPQLARAAKRHALAATATLGAVAGAIGLMAILASWFRLYSTVGFFLISIVGAGVLAVAIFLNLQTKREGGPLVALGGAGLATVAAWGVNLNRYRRFGPHGCSKCGTQLELLSQQDEQPKLSSVQRLEEEIGSVEYDVWFCPACLNADTEAYIQPFSGFKECPKCNGRTFKEKSPEVVRAATTTRTGQARVEGRCVACNHKTSYLIALPIISTGSSSSSYGGGGGFSGGGGGSGGGGFGGGSSGGGGASAGW